MLTGNDRDRVEALLRERADGMGAGRRSRGGHEVAARAEQAAAAEAHAAPRTAICASCGGPIAAARLKVLPEAVRCVSCQQLHEAANSA